MAHSEAKTNLIQVRVSPRQKRPLEVVARRRGQTLSDLLREGAAALINQGAE
ncbi:hypothetical protein [Mesorhizobium carmichaelinearum]|uniref:hypothetical protein n=1 Tax=Mesorhizobium carmichaelinearum TaxID=1208188 RepID=UPI0015CA6EB7|nr:hypothetical protein [Mesorhizobium carmichaelinearum]